PVVAFGPYLSGNGSNLAATFHDDAFYYFQIARHLAQGRGFTFDGIHPTNGFHPLWLFLLVPIYRIVPGDVPPLLAVGALALLLTRLEAVAFPLAAVLLLLRRRATPRVLAALAGPPALAGLAFIVWNRTAFGTLLPVSAEVKFYLAAGRSLCTRLWVLTDMP